MIKTDFSWLKWLIVGAMGLGFLAGGCAGRTVKVMQVTATAYNSIGSQTHPDHENITAWGDTLEPGMKCIAVSRDLIPEGLGYDTKVKIDGLPGTYRVLDKMSRRWTQRIDIYMGNDVDAALDWGAQQVTISWKVDE